MFQNSVIKAAEYAGMLVQRSDHRVRLWRKSFVDKGGEVPEVNMENIEVEFYGLVKI